jgi:hypothetical protein
MRAQLDPSDGHFRQRMRDPVYARAYRDYVASVVRQAEEAARSHRRPFVPARGGPTARSA